MPEPEAVCEPDEHEGDLRLDLRSPAVADAAEIFRTLADPARLRTLVLLAEGECCVGDLASKLGERMTTVSQRLRLLRSARLVSGRRAGKHVFYRLQDEHVMQLIRNAIEHASEH
ncbi:MAG: metalloregulator ArsR/SmtB family transcription factor [Planctomycetota bacterium]